ncbi:MobF family relaxase [Kribbella ginsengisoli]|uniref:AAA+ ATPase domain-containing protein n=1 Tax=Kribbella ginsengisoli TaxID=363865 RepID=A0ABP6Z4H8_9ACTN
MLSIHRLTAGDGYKYLLKNVATGDVDRRMATPLTAYYAAAGYPVGRWAGAGLANLGDGRLAPGSEVTEPQMEALFGRAQDPLTGRHLGRPYRIYPRVSQRVAERVAALDDDLTSTDRDLAVAQIHREESRRRTMQAVAGYDITFSPAKSVSALWATADVGVQEQIASAHYQAIDDVLHLLEEQTAYTRTGVDGVAQHKAKGLIAAAFDHWDSRSGDPQLHTHLVVANRVQAPDGQWRTLDGRVLFSAAVAMSEVHNVLLADQLNNRIGTIWDLRERGPRRNPAFEIDGIPDELIKEFSSRTEQIEQNLQALLLERNTGLGAPTRSEMYVLRQQATLMNRPAKLAARPLATLMQEWSKRAEQVLPGQVESIIRQSMNRPDQRPMVTADLGAETINAYGASVVLALQLKRSTWTRWNVIAEAARQTRLLHMRETESRMALLLRITESAEQHSISLSAPELVPSAELRSDGESIFTVHNGQVYTSPAVLGAESVLLDLASDKLAPAVRLGAAPASLAVDKAAVLRRVMESGQRVEAVVGPAGTGKTTLLAELRTRWEAEYGNGSVLALAPSAAAAMVLADSLNLPADNVAKWVHEAVGIGADQRHRWIAETEAAANLAAQSGRRRRAQGLLAKAAGARSEQDRWSFRPNQLVIVDEASMIGTMELATMAREAHRVGAKLLLVGDDAQLGAIDTGGAFRLLVQETNAAQLSEVWRFKNAWERDASLALRAGDLRVIDAYDNHDRLMHGGSDEVETAAYEAWSSDQRSGRTSLLIAGDNATVIRLNTRARLDRIEAGEVEADGVVLHDGTHAGTRDKIVTRLNTRRLKVSKDSFVRNGAIWTVIRRWTDGSLTVQDDKSETITLPADYVRESVELAYATTAHRAQGTTVDTAHLLVNDQMTRALLYVGMTRGRHSNRAYITTHESTADMHEPINEQSMQDVLEAVLNQDGIEHSAHEVMRTELDNATRLDRLIPIHEYLCQIATGQRYQTILTTSALDEADQAAIKASPAYGPLLAALRRAEAIGLNGETTLRTAITQSSLTNANDPAAVLHARVERLTTRAERRTNTTPPLIAGLVLPATNITDPQFAAPLHELESLITQRANWLADKATPDSPPWLHALKDNLKHLSLETRRQHIRDIAAFRERYQVAAHQPLGTPPSMRSYQRSRDYARLQTALLTPEETRSDRPESAPSPVAEIGG